MRFAYFFDFHELIQYGHSYHMEGINACTCELHALLLPSMVHVTYNLVETSGTTATSVSTHVGTRC